MYTGSAENSNASMPAGLYAITYIRREEERDEAYGRLRGYAEAHNAGSSIFYERIFIDRSHSQDGQEVTRIALPIIPTKPDN